METKGSTIKPMKTIRRLLPLLFLIAISTAHAQNNLYVSVNGDRSIVEYTPAGTSITFASGFTLPRGLAFDSSGNLFLGMTATPPGNHIHGKVFKFSALGHQSILGNAARAQFEGVAVDTAGNVFAVAINEQFPFAGTIYKFAPDGTRTIFGSTPGQTFDLAFDSAGNLFAADGGDQTIYKFTPNGTRTVFAGPSSFSSSQGPVGLAFDSAGNLFVSVEGDPGNDIILEFTPSGMASTFASGLRNPRGLAFDDDSGSLFVAETLANGDILEFTTGGAEIVFASGISRPEFLAFGPAR
jgi:sugar lactone lactonase YvrE